MNISIIIPSFNSQKTISKVLEHIVNSVTYVSYEVIVVDCSPGKTVDTIVHRYDNVRFIKETNRFNPGIGRNIGASYACGELLIFLDSDVLIDKKALSIAWKSYKDGYRIFDGSLVLAKEYRNGLASHLEHQFFNHQYQPARSIGKRKNLSSAFFIIEKELFNNSIGFKDIPRMQDTEFTERLSKKYDLYFIPQIKAFQIQDSKLKSVLRKIYIGGYNLYIIRYKPAIFLLKKTAFFFLLPGISFVKVGRIFIRNLRYNSLEDKIWSLVILPLLLSAALLWMLGFYISLITEAELNQNR